MIPAETGRIETAQLRALDLRERTPRATLVVHTRETAFAVVVPEGPGCVIGRGDEADVCVVDATLSRRHARFTLTPAGLEVEDLQSTHKVRIAGEAVERRVLVAGEELQLGAVTVVVLGAHGVPWLVPYAELIARIADERQRARLFARPFAVAVVRTAGPARVLLDALVALRPVDRCAFFGERELALLFPEATAHDAQRIVSAIVAQRPTAQAAVAAFPEHGTHAEQLLGAARGALARAGDVARAPATTAGVGTDALVSASAPMRALLGQVDRAARSPVPLLFIGETGTGKELLAQRVHAASGRTGPLVAVNCGAIASTLVESTLFGHEKGAFTGAAADKAGLFEAAQGGTVFLDEVGELPLQVQAALLRVVETRRVTRVGATRELPVDVRIVAATHRDLDAMVRAGTFREDLLFRLNTMTLAVPPLRARPDDILPLAERFLAEAASAQQRAVRGFTEDARALLRAHAWPGNVRELKNAVEHAVVFAGEEVDGEHLPLALRGDRTAGDGAAAGPGASTAAPALDVQVESFERGLILAALKRSQGSVGAAAQALQLPKRTLQYKMKALGLSRAVDYAGAAES